MKHAVKFNDLVYDVGMHKGEDTDYYLKKGFRVIAFEADPNLVSHCKNRFSNAIESGRLIIVEGAILEQQPDESNKRTIKFYKNKDNSVWGTVASEWANRNEDLGTSNEIIEVPVVNFVECLERYGIPHYLKIDIEGMDLVCLKALLNFDQKPDYVSIESEKVSFRKLIGEFDLFIQLGYSRFIAVQQEGISHQKEPNPSKEQTYIGYQFQEGSSGLFGQDLSYRWKNYKQIITEYKKIFLLYKLFGDYGIMNKLFFGNFLRNILSKLLRKPIPGWYDTHAKLKSLVP